MSKSPTANTAESEAESEEIIIDSKLQWQMQYLPLIALLLSAVSLGCGLFYGIRIQTDLSQIDNVVIEQIGKDLYEQQQQQQQLDQQLALYQEEVKTQLQHYQDDQANNPNAQIKQLLSVLIAQQSDYRGFLRITRQSMIEVSQMVRGSREWTSNYINQMGAVNQRSLEHSKTLNTLQNKLLQKPD